ncbi:MAG TPA: R3H domain-containing nucleic acid-binding protein [Candidatus Paceibacterota bacterium]|nr:R3H domain-containing nucleic acid-binding protein [Candidatus Paceibacterota bacterium]
METSPETILKELLEAAGIEHRGVSKSDVAGQTIYAIEADDARPVIGSRGETIQAIDYLVKKITEQKNLGAEDRQGAMFLIDVNGFRTKQIKDLQTKALMMAERARSFQYDVELSPMSAYERLIVHTTLQDAPNVKTESQGEGRSRRVVIKYAAE